MAKTYFWLKLKKDFFKSLAMKKLRKIAGGDTYTIIYLKLMLLSLENEGRLYFEGIEASFEEELALALDEDEDNIKVTLTFLESVGLLTVEENEAIALTEVPFLIGKETDKAGLMRELRKKRREQKQLESKTTGIEKSEENGNVVTGCYKDIYTTELYKPDIDNKVRSGATDVKTLEKIVETYNQICVSLPKVKVVSEPRKRKLKTRLKKYSVEDFETVFRKAEASSFLTGGGERGWKADFDWLIEEKHMVKVLEDSYIDRDKKSKATQDMENAFKMMAEWAEEED